MGRTATPSSRDRLTPLTSCASDEINIERQETLTMTESAPAQMQLGIVRFRT